MLITFGSSAYDVTPIENNIIATSNLAKSSPAIQAGTNGLIFLTKSINSYPIASTSETL